MFNDFDKKKTITKKVYIMKGCLTLICKSDVSNVIDEDTDN